MSESYLRNVIEAALLAAGTPVPLAELQRLFEDGARPSNEQLRRALGQLAADYEGRGIEPVPFDGHRVPPARTTDVSDRHAMLLGPEEWSRLEPFGGAKHIGCRDLPLAFSDHPMFDPNRPSGGRVGIGRNVSGCVNAPLVGLQMVIDQDAVIDRCAREVS